MAAHNNTVSQRIITIDALRGFALLGILLAHFIYWHTGGPLTPEVYQKDWGIPSKIVSIFGDLFIFGKFFLFFAFLFGVSFNLQIQSLEREGKNVDLRFTRRLLILLVIGVIHHLFWMGDILSIYATLGLILIFFRKLSNKALHIWGIFFALAIPNKLWDIVNFLWVHVDNQIFPDEVGKQYYKVVSSGTVWEMIQFNAGQLMGKANFQVFGGRASSTIGFFLLGMLMGRKGWLEGHPDDKPKLKKLLKYCSILMGTMLLFGLCIMGANELFKLNWQNNQVVGFFFGIIFETFNSALVLVYFAGLSLLMYNPRWQKVFYPLSHIGKLALTSYLMQTVAGLILFYHFGFQLFMKTSPAMNYGIALLFFTLQVFIAKWWLRKFYYGPVEWFWRSATIGKFQPFLRKRQVEAL